MRSFTITLLLFLSSWTIAQTQNQTDIDPDAIDPEMTKVMYLITADDIRITSYHGGQPSEFELKLCSGCQRKKYQLASEADLLLDGNPLPLKDLTISLIKKKFDLLQLGIDRTNRSITYLYLGGMSESSAEELAQEQSDEN